MKNNIVPMQLPGATLPQQSQGPNSSQGVPAGGLLAFLQTLGTINTDQSVAEKIAAILDDQVLSPQDKLKAVKDVLPNLGALMSQKHNAPATAAAPSLTSDLTAQLAAGLQGDQVVLDQLTEKFNALGEQPTDEQVTAFKNDATDFLRKLGCDDATIQKYMVSLASLLGEKITLAQSAELAMPLPGQKPSVEFANNELGAVEPAGGEDTPATPQQFALQQLSQAAKAPAQPPIPQQRVDHAPKSLPASPYEIKDAPRQPEAPAPQSRAQAANPALVNIMADENASFNANTNSFGQQGQGAFTGTLMKGPDAVQAQNFTNYMTPSSSTNATTQMVALQIQRNAAAKTETFTMQLDPMNLGRLEIKMKFTRDGAVKAHLIAEKPETLSMLQKDQPQIQRLLQQAGLEVEDNALSFDLRQQSHDQNNTKESYNGAGKSHGASAAAGVETAAVKIAVEAMGYISQSGVNIVV
ncbi:MAG: flagellar hook-length control protein FliK [Alphaproteobacteria bacterium]